MKISKYNCIGHKHNAGVICFGVFDAGYCVFVDAEHALDPSLARAIGVNTENLLLSQPDCGEQALSLVDTIIRSGSVDVVVVDSVSMMQTLLKKTVGEIHCFYMFYVLFSFPFLDRKQ